MKSHSITTALSAPTWSVTAKRFEISFRNGAFVLLVHGVHSTSFLRKMQGELSTGLWVAAKALQHRESGDLEVPGITKILGNLDERLDLLDGGWGYVVQ